MDIILIAVEFGCHKIRSSRVRYSVIVKCVSSSNQIKKVEVFHSIDDFFQLKDQIERHPSFAGLGFTFKPFLQTSFWQSERDPKIIDQRSREFAEFISQIQNSVFLLSVSPVKFFCQGFILDYNSGRKKKRRVTVACCRSRKCCTGEIENEIRNPDSESFVAISCADFHPYHKEYDQVKHQLNVAGGKYDRSERPDRSLFQVPELQVLSDEDLTLLLERNRSISDEFRYPSSDFAPSPYRYNSLTSSEDSGSS